MENTLYSSTVRAHSSRSTWLCCTTALYSTGTLLRLMKWYVHRKHRRRCMCMLTRNDASLRQKSERASYNSLFSLMKCTARLSAECATAVLRTARSCHDSSTLYRFVIANNVHCVVHTTTMPRETLRRLSGSRAAWLLVATGSVSVFRNCSGARVRTTFTSGITVYSQQPATLEHYRKYATPSYIIHIINISSEKIQRICTVPLWWPINH